MFNLISGEPERWSTPGIDACGDELKKTGELMVTGWVGGKGDEKDSGEAKKKDKRRRRRWWGRFDVELEIGYPLQLSHNCPLFCCWAIPMTPSCWSLSTSSLLSLIKSDAIGVESSR